jgi:hypothetical protein
MGCGYCIHWNQGGRNPSRYLLPFTTVRVLDQWIDPFGEGLGSALWLGAIGASGFCPEKAALGGRKHDLAICRSLTFNGQIKTASAERLCNIDHRYRIAGRRYKAFAFDDENNPPNFPPTSVLFGT